MMAATHETTGRLALVDPQSPGEPLEFITPPIAEAVAQVAIEEFEKGNSTPLRLRYVYNRFSFERSLGHRFN